MVSFVTVCIQVKLLKENFKAALPEEVMRMVDINTIDGFQVCPSCTLNGT